MIDRQFSKLKGQGASSLRVGFSADEACLQQAGNLTTIATSMRIKIASFLAMTIFLLESVKGSLSKDF